MRKVFSIQASSIVCLKNHYSTTFGIDPLKQQCAALKKLSFFPHFVNLDFISLFLRDEPNEYKHYKLIIQDSRFAKKMLKRKKAFPFEKSFLIF